MVGAVRPCLPTVCPIAVRIHKLHGDHWAVPRHKRQIHPSLCTVLLLVGGVAPLATMSLAPHILQLSCRHGLLEPRDARKVLGSVKRIGGIQVAIKCDVHVTHDGKKPRLGLKSCELFKEGAELVVILLSDHVLRWPVAPLLFRRRRQIAENHTPKRRFPV